MPRKATPLKDYADRIGKKVQTVSECKIYEPIRHSLPVFVQFGKDFLRVGNKFQNVIVEETE